MQDSQRRKNLVNYSGSEDEHMDIDQPPTMDVDVGDDDLPPRGNCLSLASHCVAPSSLQVDHASSSEKSEEKGTRKPRYGGIISNVRQHND